MLLVTKTIRVMQLTTLMLLAFSFTLSATTLSQTITFSGRDAPARDVFDQVRQQTGYLVFAKEKSLQDIGAVTAHVRDMELPKFLELVLRGKPYVYEINAKTIYIRRKAERSRVESDPVLGPSPFSPPGILRGRIIDQDGQPLPQASVSVKGRKSSTASDAQGYFSIQVEEKDVLVVSYVNHETKELVIRPSMFEANNMVITLAKSTTALDELRIVAYGTESRRMAVGAVSTIQAKDIENQPVINPLAALSGLAPGVNVAFTSGAPGSNVKLQVRGQNSLSQGTFGKPFDQPLFIVNGVPVAAQNFNVNALNSLGGSDFLDVNGGSSPFNGINPADIESISILKDAAATAIYGTQGANGVVLITTKKGKAGKTTLSATLNTAFNSATRTPELLNVQQYLNYRKEALTNDGIDLATAFPSLYPDLLLFDQDKNTDWFDYYLGKTSNNTDAHVSLSGGSDRTTFIVSPGYTRSDYNFPGDFSYKRATLHSNIHHGSMDGRLTVDFGFDYAYERNYSSASPYATRGMLTPPNFPDLFDASGNIIWNYKGFNTADYAQYAANLKQPNILQTHNMTHSLILGYRIIDHLSFRLNMGYSRITGDESQQRAASTVNPNTNPSSTATFANSIFETLNVEPQLEYQRYFGRGSFTALVGGTYRKNTTSRVQLNATGFSDESLLGSIGSAATVNATDSYNPYKYAGVFARLGYTHDQKYLIAISGRRDGSSNFGPGRQFGNFGSVGLGWIVSQEAFFRNAIPFVSYAKLSGSYGTTGSDATAPYRYQQLFKTNNQLPTFQGIAPLYVQNLFNPDYGWDTKKSINLAIDLGFLNDRLLFNLNYYRDRIGNQLVNYTLPSQTGFNSVLKNFEAKVQNKGVELNVTSKNISGKHFRWTTTINLSANRNQLIAFPGLENSSYALLYTIGRSVNIVKGYVLKGVNPETGIFEFYKTDGTTTHNPRYGIPSQGGDMQEIANTDPRFIGGIGNTFSYKNFSLSFFFQFQDQQRPNYLNSIYSNRMPGMMGNQPVAILERWTKPGDNAPVQKFTSGYSDAYFAGFYFTMSSGAYSNASYIRLRTASMSYNIPASVCQKIGLSDGRVFVNGQNLLLITNFKVGDPELNNLFSFPIQRTIAMGITVNL